MGKACSEVATVLTLIASVLVACGDDDDRGTEAQRRGVGAACQTDDDCADTAPTCLAFKGGYCGLADCLTDDDCPRGSACVTHDDGVNYCFLICGDKPQCNLYRPVADEANCSSSIEFVQATGVKACVPPS